MSGKQRLSASVDSEVLAAAQSAVDAGRSSNVSAWVNEALHRQAEHDRRMAALDEFLALYEAEHGAISEEEVREATRRARARALVVRGSRAEPSARTKPKRRSGRAR